MTPSLHQSVTKNQTTKIFVVVFVAIRENTAAPLFSLNCNNNKKAKKDWFFFTSFSCFWSLTDVMMWTLVTFVHFCNSDENLLIFSNILIGYYVHGPLPTKQNLDHGFGKLQPVFHSYFHIRNVNEDVRFETPLFQRCLEFI